MSFTAQVRDELSRVRGDCENCDYAQLSAIMRVCGSLSLQGSGKYSVKVATETGAVARTMIQLCHKLFSLDTNLTQRKSRLHKKKNFLIEIPAQDELLEDLELLGILGESGLVDGIDPRLIENDCCKAAYVRGAFMTGGFIADPRRDFHTEIAVSSRALAEALLELFSHFGVAGKLNHRRNVWAIYVKSQDDTRKLLELMGAAKIALVIEKVAHMKSLKNTVNRKVNAELANQARSTGAAAEQLLLIAEAKELVGLKALPPAIREFCSLRERHPDLSLAALGDLCATKASKSAMYHRYLRLGQLVQEARRERDERAKGL